MTGPSGWDEERFQLGLQLVERACQMSRSLQEQLEGDFFTKVDSSPVTVADLSVQALIALGIFERFPEDSLVAEETTASLSEAALEAVRIAIEPYAGPRSEMAVRACFRPTQRSVRRWILDPIDGTKGFLRGDQFAIALAHQSIDRLEFGLLGCPRLSDAGASAGEGCVGAAFRDRGAWQKSSGETTWRRLAVSSRDDVTQARLLRSFEASHTNEKDIEDLVQALGIEAEPVRMDSQAKYLLLARGDADVLIRCLSPDRPNYKEKIWDQAAGCIVLREAGGKLTDLKGQGLDFTGEVRLENNVGVLGSNGALHQQLLSGLGL